MQVEVSRDKGPSCIQYLVLMVQKKYVEDGWKANYKLMEQNVINR